MEYQPSLVNERTQLREHYGRFDNVIAQKLGDNDYGGHAILVKVDPHPIESSIDDWIANAARTSTRKQSFDPEKNAKLVKRLFKDGHSSPFEQASFTFELRVPIMVQGQIVRHRTLKLNVESARYTELLDEFYIPTLWAKQDPNNKQGSMGREVDTEAYEDLKKYVEAGSILYHKHLDRGMSREMARMFLPYAVQYSTMLITVDVRNFLHFLELRCHPHAQWETRQYAIAMALLTKPYFPATYETWFEGLPQETKDQLNVESLSNL